MRSKGGLRKLTTEKPRQSKKARSDRRESLVVCVFDNKANLVNQNHIKLTKT